MRIAVISDIHGNLEAFKAVLADIEEQNIDKIINLGDFIDYGADSEQVARIIKDKGIETIIGNHEYPLIKTGEINRFGLNALQSFEITKDNLSDEIITWIKNLPKIIVYKGCRFVHGMPPDSVNQYLTYQSKYELVNRFLAMNEKIAFIGHTHLQKIVTFTKSDMGISISSLRKGPVKIDDEHKYIVNVGSIGQPRSSNKKAKYVIYDMDERLLQSRYLDYDVNTAVEKIRKAGYPESNANILYSNN